jgi:phenylalanyl-tRNA synthetase beta chain
VWNGTEELQIVCGAPNVAAGQKVVLARIGAQLQPDGGEPFKIKKAKIRGTESYGMLCSAAEIGLSGDHSGILVLPAHAVAGQPVTDYLPANGDTIFEIGLTPNRSDAMSHYGVARDLCAYLSYHEERNFQPVFPEIKLKPSGNAPVAVTIENQNACMRYSGLVIKDVKVAESPEWLKEKLQAIGVKPHNNIVDITNFILHETGQPLHAFDADKIEGDAIIVKTVTAGTPFTTLDNTLRKLTENDLMICDAVKPLCIAGVYGGINSGVTENTKRIFLESACFSSEYIRRTSVHHQLRTDAASRYEKGTDVSITVKVLLRAAELIVSLCDGKTDGAVVDVYPSPLVPVSVDLSHQYLQKISGKQYDHNKVPVLLQNLGYGVKDNNAGWKVSVPFHKPHVQIAAEVVQDIMRMDGLDRIPFPGTIPVTPIAEDTSARRLLNNAKHCLTYKGFHEIFTNSLTNSNWYDEASLKDAVKMKNALSSELDTLRISMLPGGLNCIAYNINRKNHNLRFYEHGKIYARTPNGYAETKKLSIYVTGNLSGDWKHREQPADFFYLKGIVNGLFAHLGIQHTFNTINNAPHFSAAMEIKCGKLLLGTIGEVSSAELKRFSIKQPVFAADLNWNSLLQVAGKPVIYKEVPRFPSAVRDLSILVNKDLPFAEIEKSTRAAGITKLAGMGLFDVFENEKLGADKKSLAISYTFIDEERTLTDAEMDKMVAQLVARYEKDLKAEIRKQ